MSGEQRRCGDLRRCGQQLQTARLTKASTCRTTQPTAANAAICAAPPQPAVRCEKGQCVSDCLPGYFDLDGKLERVRVCLYAEHSGIEICDARTTTAMAPSTRGRQTWVNPAPGGGCQPGFLTCIAGARICVGAGQTQAGSLATDATTTLQRTHRPRAIPTWASPATRRGLTAGSLQTGTCTGQCRLGAWVCTAGALVCQGAVTPQLESVEAKTNDCAWRRSTKDFIPDGSAALWPLRQPCIYNPTRRGYVGNGQCQMGPCQDGWADADHSNGCHPACTPDGPEVCDGTGQRLQPAHDGDDPGLIQPNGQLLSADRGMWQGPGGSAHFPGDASFPVCVTAIWPPARRAGSATTRLLCSLPAQPALWRRNHGATARQRLRWRGGRVRVQRPRQSV